jgi:hypothetical protein
VSERWSGRCIEGSGSGEFGESGDLRSCRSLRRRFLWLLESVVSLSAGLLIVVFGNCNERLYCVARFLIIRDSGDVVTTVLVLCLRGW